MIGNKSEIRLLQRGVYIGIGSITEVGELQRMRDEVDITTYGSNAIETQLLLEDNGELSLMFNYREEDDTQSLIETSFNENKVEDWEFYLNDTKGTTKRFKAGVKSFSLNPPNVENVTISASLRVSGGFTTIYSARGSVTFKSTVATPTVLPARTIISITVEDGIVNTYRTTTQVTVPANGTVTGSVICMQAGTVGNLNANIPLTVPNTGISVKSSGALTGGTDA